MSRFGKKIESNPGKALFHESSSHGVNLGALYKSSAYIQSPFLDKRSNIDEEIREATTIHLALVKVRASPSITDGAIIGVGRSLSQLAKLGMLGVIVVSQEDYQNINGRNTIQSIRNEAKRIIEAIQIHGDHRAQMMDNIVHTSNVEANSSPLAMVDGGVRIKNQGQLYAALMRGIIPVVPCVGVITKPDHHIVNVEANDALIALTRDLTWHQAQNKPKMRDREVSMERKDMRYCISVDRIIVLDPLGGVPSTDRNQGSHVYINVEQEYKDIKAILEDLQRKPIEGKEISMHIQNLDLVKNVLSLLPPSSSGFITTLHEVAKLFFY